VAAHVVVVGAGLAGLNTAIALRARGFPGRITMLGAEPHPPYDRPPLSKAFLAGDAESIRLRADFTALDVTFRCGAAATGLVDGGVSTASGRIDADAVVVATGATPIRLPGPGSQLTLRTVDDAVRLRSAFVEGRRIVIVGAGWIGAELATRARAAGCTVTVLEAAGTPLATALPPEIGALTGPWWREAGVDLRTGTPVATVEPNGVVLVDGDVVAADDVVVAVGVRPTIGWLAGSALDLTGGAVRVDERLRAAPGVFAVGDVAAWWSRRYGSHLRVEHWDNALHSPSVVAAELTGDDLPHDPVPYVWSEQFGRFLQLAGRPGPDDTMVWRGDPRTDAAWSICWLGADSSVRAVLAVDRPRDATQARRLAERGTVVDPERLADPGVQVKQAVA
jgi:3-phenylpropionate/trans-cinnamate dioxygenase ferredoxin reductase subunit